MAECLHLITDTATEQLSAAKSEIEKICPSRGLEVHMNTETRGSSLAMIESYDDDNELGDNDAEQTEISRKHPRNSSLDLLHFTKGAVQLAEAIRDLAKTLLSRGSEIHMNAGFLAKKIYDDDNELGDNDAEQTDGKVPILIIFLCITKGMDLLDGAIKVLDQCFLKRDQTRKVAAARRYLEKHCFSLGAVKIFLSCGLEIHMNTEISSKSLRKSSLVSLHVTKGTELLALGISDLQKEDPPEELVKTEFSRKRPRNSSEDSGMVTAKCKHCNNALKENNGNDTSRKRLKGTSRTKSGVWQHFTKLPSADPGGVMAGCNYCKKPLKADSKNGTSHLWRHFNKLHAEEAKSNYPN